MCLGLGNGYIKSNMDIYDYIQKAIVQSTKEEINANAIIISSDLIKTSFRNTPMICGLKKYIACDLPDDYAFAIANVENDTDTFSVQLPYKVGEKVYAVIKNKNRNGFYVAQTVIKHYKIGSKNYAVVRDFYCNKITVPIKNIFKSKDEAYQRMNELNAFLS
jgi:hypothetical protein